MTVDATQLLVFILACYGLTGILIYGHLFDRIRPAGRFWRCAMCVGFWVGVAVFMAYWVSGWQLFPSFWVGSVLYGCLSSGTSYFLRMLVDDFGIRITRGGHDA